MVNHYGVHVGFWNIEYQFLKISFINFFVVTFYEIFVKFERSSTHLNQFRGNFCDIAQPYKLFTVEYLRYENSLFLS